MITIEQDEPFLEDGYYMVFALNVRDNDFAVFHVKVVNHDIFDNMLHALSMHDDGWSITGMTKMRDINV